MSESHVSESPIRRPLRRQPHKQQQQQPDPLNCPRCESTNTKFCYYNNYNKTQPRYFCKACKRHWTKGGTLRNVPIGGGWKNKRLRRPNNTATSSMVNSNTSSIGRDSASDPKKTCDASKASFAKPTDSKRRDDNVESYIDIEELKGLVSCDFYGSFIGCTMQELGHEDLPRLGFSKLSSSFETNPSSNMPRSFIEILENGEDSTIPTSVIMPSSQQTNNILELSNWDWDDFDIIDQ